MASKARSSSNHWCPICARLVWLSNTSSSSSCSCDTASWNVNRSAEISPSCNTYKVVYLLNRNICLHAEKPVNWSHHCKGGSCAVTVTAPPHIFKICKYKLQVGLLTKQWPLSSGQYFHIAFGRDQAKIVAQRPVTAKVIFHDWHNRIPNTRLIFSQMCPSSGLWKKVQKFSYMPKTSTGRKASY